MTRFIAFLRDVRDELAKVQWPTKKELFRYTLIVIGMSLGVAIFLGAWDFFFEWLLQTFILK